jgi:PPM family protein phosphatase
MATQIETSFKLKGFIESQIGGRAENQDSAGAVDAKIGTVITVCDGMGGHNGGSTASEIAVKTVIDDVAKAHRLDDPVQVLKDAISHANRAIMEAGEKDPSLRGMGTTLTAAIVSSRCVTVAHIGDSRIYQLRGGEKVFRTNDHSQVFEMVKAGLMDEEAARTSSNSNIILKALGITEEIEPEIAELPYVAGDRFILCTDGFWNPFPEEHFIKLVSEGRNVGDVLDSVSREIDLVGIQGGNVHDNFTAAMFDLRCDSKMKIDMRRSTKILIAALSLALVASLALNLHFACDGAGRAVTDGTQCTAAAVPGADDANAQTDGQQPPSDTTGTEQNQ